METFENNGRLGSMVRVLEVENVDTGGGATWDERQMKSFFATLINLELLQLGSNTTSLLDIVLSLPVGRSTLPRLGTLRMETPFECNEPFDFEVYRHLDDFPSLDRLEISTAVDRYPYRSSTGGRRFSKIKEIVLKGVHVDDVSTSSCVEHFPNLISLTLDTASITPNYSYLVPNLPVSLTSLTLLTRCFYDDYSRPCDPYFPRFVNLEHLYLSRGTFSQDLINPLSELPKLKTLGFGKGAFLSCSRLEEMILGPNRLRSLEKVVFDQVEGRIGWRIEDDSDGFQLHPDHEDEPCHLGPDWVLPKWSESEGFEEHNVFDTVTRIKLSGIKVEGSILDAFGVGEELDREAFHCTSAYGMQTGDWEPFRRCFGDEAADEMVRIDRETVEELGGRLF
ncbi:uncharacterized protein JCM6883_004504 [Sporobolomyces salmoneus]|uniref:uncharacterized protein n=1 Tax=Sporobolomyces salmoneus TaxID=183962 RepID=UPI00317A2322